MGTGERVEGEAGASEHSSFEVRTTSPAEPFGTIMLRFHACFLIAISPARRQQTLTPPHSRHTPPRVTIADRRDTREPLAGGEHEHEP